MFLKNSRTAITTLVLFTILTGLLYPLVVTGFAQLVFPYKANGSLIKKDGKAIGSELIGQPFIDPKYFWSRPSATVPSAYDAGASSGSNYGPINQIYFNRVKKRIQDLKAVDSTNTQSVPVDLVTTSGSGLDPHISVAAALYQLPRVTRIRNLNQNQVRSMLAQCTKGRQLGSLGESRVNVLKLNLALDAMQSSSGGK